MPVRRRLAARTAPVALAVTAGASLVLAGCTSPVAVDVAPRAADPRCAAVLAALPDELAGRERRQTTAQATTAWGGAGTAVVLRCGVEPLGPTTESCTPVPTAGGVTVDWVQREARDGVFQTYGREPAVEVRVPVEGDVNPVLTAVGDAAAVADLVGACS